MGKWLANDDTCGICRVAFDDCCPDCKFAGDDCPLVSSIDQQMMTIIIMIISSRFGESAPTVSTFTASRSGGGLRRHSTSAPCADKTGNTESKLHPKEKQKIQ